eukprot:scaffold5033_cov106-Isochrysis_galbana.AAC.2
MPSAVFFGGSQNRPLSSLPPAPARAAGLRRRLVAPPATLSRSGGRPFPARRQRLSGAGRRRRCVFGLELPPPVRGGVSSSHQGSQAGGRWSAVRGGAAGVDAWHRGNPVGRRGGGGGWDGAAGGEVGRGVLLRPGVERGQGWGGEGIGEGAR